MDHLFNFLRIPTVVTVSYFKEYVVKTSCGLLHIQVHEIKDPYLLGHLGTFCSSSREFDLFQLKHNVGLMDMNLRISTATGPDSCITNLHNAFHLPVKLNSD